MKSKKLEIQQYIGQARRLLRDIAETDKKLSVAIKHSQIQKRLEKAGELVRTLQEN